MEKFDFWDRATSTNMRYHLVHYFTAQFVNRNILAAICAFDVLAIIFYDLYEINITFAMSLQSNCTSNIYHMYRLSIYLIYLIFLIYFLHFFDKIITLYPYNIYTVDLIA